ncbi:SDR family oxidoreductase [Dechloromonas sp. XY25]|uniref:SDR family oxidoreductase n=1 Tax=Dechloromonas hankyongensis TaxID=2908002 RepID=A0ABS9K6C2_9RHOO|nr:SDR family oxidoreductase [Dechloromonas hankyongensis]MCG2578730.1 SDR family oxidoreductase [Dechloromonas hankyongensis]
MSAESSKTTLPPQHQERQPGRESEMQPPPASFADHYVGSGRLQGQVALVTGGDSGIGRATAIAFAKEGADVAIAYLEECDDARQTRQAIEACGRRALAIAVDLGDEAACRQTVERVVGEFGRLDVLVNNAAEQHPQDSLADISSAQLERTFRTNVFAMFYCTKAALPHLQAGARIINTASVTAYLGSPHLLDYSASKGAIVSFTRSLALQLVDKGIRVNAVAPGPIWTPLIPSTFAAGEVGHFGANTPMERPGQPDEVAPALVFLATDASSYMTGQVLHPNGGRIVNG